MAVFVSRAVLRQVAWWSSGIHSRGGGGRIPQVLHPCKNCYILPGEIAGVPPSVFIDSLAFIVTPSSECCLSHFNNLYGPIIIIMLYGPYYFNYTSWREAAALISLWFYSINTNLVYATVAR